MYNVDYFIAKFEAIPASKWCIGSYSNGQGSYCALGWCGDVAGKEARALANLIPNVAQVNDNTGNKYLGDTAKERILNVLKKVRGY